MKIPASPPSSPEERNDRKVLVVEDSDALRDLYAIVLRREGYDVESVALAESALGKASEWRPDLVLTDLFMPGLGGLELITRLRSDLTPPIPPIVAVSGFPDARAEALRRGAARFVTKPISNDELVHVVEEVLGREREPRPGPERVVGERRAATRALGAAALARLLTQDAGVVDRVRAQTAAAATFFEDSTVLMFFLRDDALKLVATSDERFRLDATAADVLPILNDVAESESRLVLTGLDTEWLAPRCGGMDVRFLVAVPYLLDQVVVGVLCLVDDVPHEFGSAECGILEYMAHRGSSVVRGGPPILDPSGIYEPVAFRAILDGAAASARNTGRALAFAMHEVSEAPGQGSLTGLFTNLPGPYVMIGVVDGRHLGAFAVAESADVASERLELLRRQLEAEIALTRAVEVTFDDPVPPLEHDALVARGRALLDRAVDEGRDFLAVDSRRR